MNLDSFDRTLQDDLHRALADTELPSLDPDALVATGGRLLRRRNRTRALTGVAAAVAVALGGYAAQGNFVRDAAPNPPASQTATDTASPTAPVTTVLERFSGVAAGTSAAPGDPVPGPTHFAVTVSPVTADGQDLTYSVVADDGTLTAMGGSSTVGLDRNAVTWGTSGPLSHAIVGILPAAARDFTIVTPDDPSRSGGSESTRAILPGTGWQAFAAKFEEAADVEAITDILWVDASGVVHDKSGALVPSVTLTDRDATTVYLAESADVMGTFSAGGGSNGRIWLSTTRAASKHPVLAVSSGGETRLSGLFAMLIPSGSLDPELVPAAGLTSSSTPQIAEFPGTGQAILWADFATDGPNVRPFAKVAWTEPGGQRVTVTDY